jgi:hypothetical protein
MPISLQVERLLDISTVYGRQILGSWARRNQRTSPEYYYYPQSSAALSITVLSVMIIQLRLCAHTASSQFEYPCLDSHPILGAVPITILRESTPSLLCSLPPSPLDSVL